MMAVDYDVVVVGLGPVGLVMAAALGRAGHKVLALETSDGQHVSPRATALDDESMRFLQRTGILPEFLGTTLRAGPIQVVTDYITPGANPVPEFVFGYKPKKYKTVGQPGQWPPLEFPKSYDPRVTYHNGFHRGSFLFYQPKFEDLFRNLLKTMSNVDVRFLTKCENMSQQGDVVNVDLRKVEGDWVHQQGGEHIFVLNESQESPIETISARYLVGCDGAKSMVRKYINPTQSFISLDYDKEWIAVDIEVKDESAVFDRNISSYSQFICTADRQYIVIPCSYCFDRPNQGRHIRFDFSVNDSDPENRSEMETKEYVEKLVAPWFKPDEFELVRTSVYRFHCLMAPQWKRGNVILAGDSCHTQAPFLGQGLNQGIKDVSNLWWKLSAVLHNRAGPELLDTYQTERYKVALNVVSHAKQLGQLMNKLSAAQAEGNAKVHAATAEAEEQSDVRLSKLWNLAYSTIDIPRKVNSSLRSKYDGTMIHQFKLEPIHPASPYKSLPLDDVLPAHAPFTVLLVGLQNTIEEYFSKEQVAFFNRAHIPVLRIALKSQRRELPDTTIPVHWVDEEQDPNILVENELIVVRRDGFIFGSARNTEESYSLLKELEYADWFLGSSSSSSPASKL